MASQVWRAFCKSRHKFYCMQARSRYKFSSGRVFIQVYEIGKRLVAQCRGINYPGATICLGIASYITCSGGYPGLRLRLILLKGSESAKNMTNNLPLLAVLAQVISCRDKDLICFLIKRVSS